MHFQLVGVRQRGRGVKVRAQENRLSIKLSAGEHSSDSMRGQTGTSQYEHIQ